MVIEILHKSLSLGRTLKKYLQGVKNIYISLSSNFQLEEVFVNARLSCQSQNLQHVFFPASLLIY